MSACTSAGSEFHSFVGLLVPILPFASSSLVSGGVTTAHQVPAVSQSVYSPPTPETPDSLLSTPPQTHLMKSLPHSFSTAQTTPTITGLPPTQPTAKVISDLFLNLDLTSQSANSYFLNKEPWPKLFILFFFSFRKKV